MFIYVVLVALICGGWQKLRIWSSGVRITFIGAQAWSEESCWTTNHLMPSKSKVILDASFTQCCHSRFSHHWFVQQLWKWALFFCQRLISIAQPLCSMKVFYRHRSTKKWSYPPPPPKRKGNEITLVETDFMAPELILVQLGQFCSVTICHDRISICTNAQIRCCIFLQHHHQESRRGFAPALKSRQGDPAVLIFGRTVDLCLSWLARGCSQLLWKHHLEFATACLSNCGLSPQVCNAFVVNSLYNKKHNLYRATPLRNLLLPKVCSKACLRLVALRFQGFGKAMGKPTGLSKPEAMKSSKRMASMITSLADKQERGVARKHRKQCMAGLRSLGAPKAGLYQRCVSIFDNSFLV